MIEVIIKSGRKELGRITLENLGPAAEFGDYTAQFGVDTGEGWAVYQRGVEHFPRRRYNVLGLLRIALSALEEKELTLDADPDSDTARRSSDLARRLPRPMWPF
jgi:hypothetical protein